MNLVYDLLIFTIVINTNVCWQPPILKFKGASKDLTDSSQSTEDRFFGRQSGQTVDSMCVADGRVFVTLARAETILVLTGTDQISELIVPLGPSGDGTHSHTAIFPSHEANSSLYILDTRLPETMVDFVENKQVAESMKVPALLWKVELMPGGIRQILRNFDEPVIFHVSSFTGNYVVLYRGEMKPRVTVYKKNWDFGRTFQLAMSSAHPDNLVELPDGTLVVLSSIKPSKSRRKIFLTKITAGQNPGQITNIIPLKYEFYTGMAVDRSGNIYVTERQSVLVADKDLTQVRKVLTIDGYIIRRLYITPQTDELYLVGKMSKGFAGVEEGTVVRVYDIETL